MPKVLGLDLASHTGFAIVTSMDCQPSFGWWDAPGERFGVYARRFSSLQIWLEEMHMVHSFDGIAFEAPILVPSRDTINTPRLLMGFSCIVETFAGRAARQHPSGKFPCMEVAVQAVKKALTGNAYASKPEMKHAAIRLGWQVADHDQADAGAVAFTAFANFWPELARPS